MKLDFSSNNGLDAVNISDILNHKKMASAVPTYLKNKQQQKKTNKKNKKKKQSPPIFFLQLFIPMAPKYSKPLNFAIIQPVIS